MKTQGEKQYPRPSADNRRPGSVTARVASSWAQRTREDRGGEKRPGLTGHREDRGGRGRLAGSISSSGVSEAVLLPTRGPPPASDKRILHLPPEACKRLSFRTKAPWCAGAEGRHTTASAPTLRQWPRWAQPPIHVETRPKKHATAATTQTEGGRSVLPLATVGGMRSNRCLRTPAQDTSASPRGFLLPLPSHHRFSSTSPP